MRAVIIGNGYIKNYEYIKSKILKDDYIICADGGYNHAVKMGIKPDVLIGDFDSAKDYEGFKDRIQYPVRKDFTDGELAVRYAIEHGFEDIVLIALTGNRLDHTMADIFLLSLCPKGIMIDDNNEIYLLKDTLRISGRKGQTLSIVPVSGDALGLSTKGLEYPLYEETLYFASSRGISNVMTEEICEISIKKGMALVIKVEKA
ncbi:MAG: thiamine diphosphokinase [Oscillospiraceae bacterium]|nr:thiamine diphosphokinase [Oscillospiraceae bacterium]